jgi:hypothetical protein
MQWLELITLLRVLGADLQEQPSAARVVVLRPPSSDEVTTEAVSRVAGELAAAGFAVTYADSPPGTDLRSQLDAAAGAAFRPVAVFAISRAAVGNAADIWIADRGAGKLVIQRVEIGGEDQSHRAAVLAVRAVELLRASLLNLWRQTPKPPPVGAPAPSTQAGEVAARPAATENFLAGVTVGAGVGVMSSFRGVDPTFLPVLRVSYGWQRLAVRLTGAGLGTASHLSAAVGSATVKQAVIGGEMLAIWSRSRHVQGLAAVGVGAYHIDLQGAAPPSSTYRGQHDELWTPFVSGAIGGSVRVGPSTAVGLDLQATFTRTEATLRILDTVVGRTGRPAFLAGVSLLQGF